MVDRKPMEIEAVLGFWARLTMIEQCSLAILHQSLLTPDQWRAAFPRRRRALHDPRKQVSSPIENHASQPATPEQLANPLEQIGQAFK